MNSSSLGVASSSNLAFSFQTSSGDKIDLQLYSQKQLGYEQNKDGESLMFASKEGYKFRFETNGLSEQDKAEIADAMKKIEPMINKFIDDSGSNSFLKEPLDMVAANINATLPKPKDDNAKNALSASTVGLFDNLLKKAEKPKDLFEDMQKLLDKILKNIQNPQNVFYA
ncbi:MAG: hypothetical protein AB7D29_05080 [Campylobacterales bacterium]